MTATNGNDVLTGTIGDDIIDALAGDDTIDVSQGGTDTVNAGGGDDIIIGQNDASTPGMIDGGAGFDVLRFVDPTFGTSSSGFSSQNDFLTRVNSYEISNIERVEVIQSGTLSTLFINGSTAADMIDLSAEVANRIDVRTGSGSDTVTLGAGFGTFSLALGSGIDTYNGVGASGTVSLLAGSGADIYNGGAAIETISYFFSTVGVNVNLLTGIGSGGFAAGETYSNIENIEGTSFADTLIGDANSNTLQGRGGDDIIDGGAGNDTLETDGGNVTFTGGTGDDLFSFRIFNSSLDGEITDFELGDTLEIGQIRGPANSSIVPIFIGTAAFSNVVGEIRYEFVSGTTELQLDTDGDGVADDTLVLSNGEFDILDTETGFFDLVLAVSPPPINGSSGNDTLNGTVNNDVINGLGGNDIITTLAGNDIVDAGGGADTIILSQDGSGTIDGGTGLDLVQIETGFLSQFATNQDAIPEITVFTNVGSYNLSRVERIEGLDSTTGDVNNLILVGNNGSNNFDLTGESVNFGATIYAGGSDDTVTANDNGSSLDVFLGNGNDVFNGGIGFSNIRTGLGADTINGGSGFEIVSYDDSTVGVTVNLDTGVSLGGTAQGDVLLNIESINGSLFDDTLTGSVGNDQFQGSDGNDIISGLDGNDFLNGGFGDDTIDGGSGNDVINGGAGVDTLTGGSGLDVFQIFEYSNNAFADTITDFESGDRISLFEGFDGNSFILPNFIGTDAFSNIAGELRYENTNGQTLLQLDLDGDGVTDQTLTIANGEFDLAVTNSQSFSFDLVLVEPPIEGTSGADILTGTVNDDIINGFGGDDIITTLSGNDTVDAGGGADTIILSQDGSGTIDGGGGQDLVQIETGFLSQSVSNQDTAPEITVFTNVGTYNLSRVERVEGLDVATGDINNLILLGTGGANTFDLTGEVINFGATIYAGGSNDTVTANDNGSSLTVFLGNGNDTFNGGTGFSTIQTGLGADIINGGSGFEFVDYGDSTVGVNVNLDTGVNTGGTAEGDILNNIEQVFGTFFDDTIIGSSANETFWGATGNDIVNSGGGDDTLFASNGNMIFTGGTGADDFNVFTTSSNFFDGEITDFEVEDRITISEFSFAPVFIGSSGFTNTVGEIRYEHDNGQTILQLDDTGDGIADHFLTISNGEFDLANTGTSANSLSIIIDNSIPGVIMNTNDSGVGSLRQAILDSNASNGTVPIVFDPAVIGQTISVLSALDVSANTDIDGDVNIFLDQNTSLFTITSDSTSLTLNANDITIDVDETQTSDTLSIQSVIDVSDSDDVTVINNSNIIASGIDDGGFFGDRLTVIGSNSGIGDNFTFINQAGASISTTGRFAVAAQNFIEDITATTIVNDGTLIATDDTIRIQTGTITNSGLIESTGETAFVNGDAADAISAFNILDNLDPMNFPVAEGGVLITNTETGVIDGHRTGIIISTGGRVDNDGLITGESAAIFAQGRFDGNDPVDFTLNNTGTLSSEGESFGFNSPVDDNFATLSFSGDLGAIAVNNSGIIESPDFAISSFSGATINNLIDGQILADTDGTNDDAVAFRGSVLDDFIVEAFQTTAFVDQSTNLVSDQGITIDANGDLVLSDGTFLIAGPTNGGGSPTGTFVADVFLLALIDIAATQNAGALVYQTDTNGISFPSTIDVVSPTFGSITVNFVSGQGFTVSDSNGDPVFDVPAEVDFADTITNEGLIDGDIQTGLGDDTVINSGVIDGDIFLDGGNDSFASTAASTGVGLNIDGGSGNDIIDSGNDDDFVVGGLGEDTLRGGNGNDTLFGEDDNDVLFGESGNDIIDGGIGDDIIDGGTGNDNLNGESGNDTLNGGGNNDIIDGGNGIDIIDGGTGADTLRGGGGDDTIDGGVSADSISGGIGNDTANGGDGNDTILGQGGADTLFGDAGMDMLRGGSGNDVLFGGEDRDLLFGQGNNDILHGEGGNDSLSGAAGSDQLFGGAGDDTLLGSVGADRLDGGTGDDVLNGGNMDGARDTFVFAVGYDEDRINAFDQAGTDRLELDEDLWAGAGTLTAQQVVDMFGSLNGNGTILTLDFGNGDILEVQSGAGIDADTLGEDILFI